MRLTPSAVFALCLLCQCSPSSGPDAHAFDVQVSLTPAALTSVKVSGEKMRVSTLYSADTKVPANDGMPYLLASESLEIDGRDQTVRMTGKTVTADRLAKTTGPVHVSVYAESAQTVTQAHLLDCTSVQTTLSKAKSAPVTISCDVAVPPPLSTVPYGYDLVLRLTPAARQKLNVMHEKITIASMFSGTPVASAKAQADEAGEIALGNGTINVMPGTTAFRVDSSGLDPSKLPLITGQPRLLINIYSARLRAQDNLLDCDIFEGTLSEARARPITITCKLIEPDPAQGGAQ